MRKLILFGCIIIALVTLGGCSISNDYCCTSNDQCRTTAEGLHSCSNDTCGKCVPVKQLTISPTTLTDATIEQTNYSVELTASGGISPYTWLLTRGDETKLNWLTITQEGDTKAILQNLAPLYPNIISDAIPLTITLKDSSKHGTDVTREDDQGKAFQLTINIKNCNTTSCDNGDNTITPAGTNRCSNGLIKTCSKDTTFGCANWGEATNCSTGSCQTLGQFQNISCCPDQNHCSSTNDPQRCNAGWMEKCKNDTSGCLSWQQDTQCSDNGCMDDGSGCKECSNNCTTEGSYNCSSDNTAVTICQKGTNQCLDWTLYENCTDNNTSHCLSPGCTAGTCNFRYTIQQYNGIEEVKDTTTTRTLCWKRQVEQGSTQLFSWTDANDRCNQLYSGVYRLPSKVELLSIIQTNPTTPYFNGCAFPDVDVTECTSCYLRGFWSSTIYEGNPNGNYYYAVFLYGGASQWYNIASTYYARCVRSCQ